jgi:hypothetical protein
VNGRPSPQVLTAATSSAARILHSPELQGIGGILVELGFTAATTEMVSLSVVFRGTACTIGVDLHPADRISLRRH